MLTADSLKSAPALSATETAEMAALGDMWALLEREHDALMARDSVAITLMAAEKMAALARLDVFARQRKQAHAKLPLGETTPPDPRIQDAWKKVQAANWINDAILALHSSKVSRGLGVLRQAAGAEGPYNARGRMGGHYLSVQS